MIHPTETSIRGTWRNVEGRVAASDECARIESLVRDHLRERVSSQDGWSTLYVDPTDGRLWEHTYPESHCHGGGPPAITTLAPTEAHVRFGYPPFLPAELPPTILQALRPAQAALSAAGYFPSSASESESFGDFSVTFSSPRGVVQVSRDRGQFLVSGPDRQELENAGLWRTFPGSHELAMQLKAWLRHT